MSENNLIFASASFHPNRKSIISKRKDLLQREEDYLFCIKQLLRVVPKNFEIYIVDNTIKNSDSLLNTDLKNLLNNLNVLYSPDPSPNETKNIGVGELKELFHLENTIDFNKYSKICYLTSRRFITNPYVFEKTDQLRKEALLSNPDFIYLDGEVIPSEKKGMFNDMFFAMKSKTMQEYISFSKERIDYLDENLINSETNLYDFITEFNISSEYLMFLGFFRYDYYRKNSKENKHKYHFV